MTKKHVSDSHTNLDDLTVDQLEDAIAHYMASKATSMDENSGVSKECGIFKQDSISYRLN